MEGEKINSIRGEPVNQEAMQPTHTALGEYVGGRPVGFDSPITPWQESRLDKCLGALRFLWGVCLMVNKIMIGIFSIVFTYHFAHHLWDWCDRVLFTGQW